MFFKIFGHAINLPHYVNKNAPLSGAYSHMLIQGRHGSNISDTRLGIRLKAKRMMRKKYIQMNIDTYFSGWLWTKELGPSHLLISLSKTEWIWRGFLDGKTNPGEKSPRKKISS